jgi:hypothetical protein
VSLPRIFGDGHRQFSAKVMEESQGLKQNIIYFKNVEN